MKERQIAILGASASGKSTWIGALASSLLEDSAEHVCLVDVAAAMAPLLRLSEPLELGEYPKRTPIDHQTDLELPLATKGERFPDARFTLRVGDYAGEQVERLFRDRARGWSEAWKTRARADAIVLFLRPEATTPLPRLEPSRATRDQWEALRSSSPEAPATVHLKSPQAAGPEDLFSDVLVEEAADAPAPAPGEPVRVPTVLALVELLQFLRDVRGLAPGERPPTGALRIVLLASAWDQVDQAWRTNGQGPAAFLAEQAPLLHDFLWSNFHADDVFRFGLSSTGGDLGKLGHRERYEEEPGGFVEWTDTTGHLCSTRDLALPLYWALFGDAALKEG